MIIVIVITGKRTIHRQFPLSFFGKTIIPAQASQIATLPLPPRTPTPSPTLLPPLGALFLFVLQDSASMLLALGTFFRRCLLSQLVNIPGAVLMVGFNIASHDEEDKENDDLA